MLIWVIKLNYHKKVNIRVGSCWNLFWWKDYTFNGLSSDFIENTVYTDYNSSQELSNLIANNKVLQ